MKRVSKADMQYTNLQKILMSMPAGFTPYEIFMDWIEALALSISNSVDMDHGELWSEREATYKAIMDKYSETERLKMCEMTACLVDELEENPRDVLGEAFMRSGMGSDSGGQFFTPFNISKMLASISVISPEDGKEYTINEPSCGSGGSIIAAALELQSRGINYQKCMRAVCQDLDWRCVHMCYVQLSLLGIDAICCQGDTLLEPYVKGYPERKIFRTPQNKGALV